MSDADARRDAAREAYDRWVTETQTPGSLRLPDIASVAWRAAWAAASKDRAAHGRAEFERALALVEAEATPSRWGWGGTRESVERVRQAEQARRRESGEG